MRNNCWLWISHGAGKDNEKWSKLCFIWENKKKPFMSARINSSLWEIFFFNYVSQWNYSSLTFFLVLLKFLAWHTSTWCGELGVQMGTSTLGIFCPCMSLWAKESLLCSSQGGEGFVSKTCCVLVPCRNSLNIIKLIVFPDVANASWTGQRLVVRSWSNHKYETGIKMQK